MIALRFFERASAFIRRCCPSYAANIAWLLRSSVMFPRCLMNCESPCESGRGVHGELIIEADELSSSLRWLATLPVTEIRAEPIGLRSVYDRFHANREATA